MQLMKIEQLSFRNTSFSHMTWPNHDAPSMIRWMGLNIVDLYHGISFGLLINYQKSNRIAMSNFCLFILPLFDGVIHSRIFN